MFRTNAPWNGLLPLDRLSPLVWLLGLGRLHPRVRLFPLVHLVPPIHDHGVEEVTLGALPRAVFLLDLASNLSYRPSPTSLIKEHDRLIPTRSRTTTSRDP